MSYVFTHRMTRMHRNATKNMMQHGFATKTMLHDQKNLVEVKNPVKSVNLFLQKFCIITVSSLILDQYYTL